MWIAKDWNDYELLGCGNGLRLERWGNHKILRPDTNAKFPIWHGTGRLLYDGRYTSGKNGGHWECENLYRKADKHPSCYDAAHGYAGKIRRRCFGTKNRPARVGLKFCFIVWDDRTMVYGLTEMEVVS